MEEQKIQHYLSSELEKYLSDKMEIFIDGSDEEYSILLLGYDNGILLDKLKKRFPNSRITLVDENLKDLPNVKHSLDLRLLSDRDTIGENGKKIEFDLIFSLNLLCWKVDLQKALEELEHFLNYGGKIVFTGLSKDTYYYYDNNDNLNSRRAFCFQKFPGLKDLKENLPNHLTLLTSDFELKVNNYQNQEEIGRVIENLDYNRIYVRGKSVDENEFYKLQRFMNDYNDKGYKIESVSHLIYFVLEKRYYP